MMDDWCSSHFSTDGVICFFYTIRKKWKYKHRAEETEKVCYLESDNMSANALPVSRGILRFSCKEQLRQVIG